MSIDRYGRNINYLRISLTDVCNLRCVYCMPEAMQFRPQEELMQDGEIIRLAGLFAGLGTTKIRFTGGEPTLHPMLSSIADRISGIEGIEELAMTTNGIRLRELARPLADAGVKRVNISIDTLDPVKFKRLTRWGNVQDVWKGIHAAETAGMDIKLNAVVVRGFNDSTDAVDLARLSLEHPWQVRFIEMMPFAGVSEFQKSNIVSEAELLETISAELGAPELQHEGRLDGEARIYRWKDAPGSLGFISAVTQPFCAGCNRIRLTADGKLRLCLLREKELDLLTPLRDGMMDDELAKLIEDAIWYKPWGHRLAEDLPALNRTMSEIGG